MVSDVDFTAGEGLQVFFDFGFYGDITVVSSPAEFDFLSWNPSEVFGTQKAGVVDALAKADFSGNFSFTVSYNWLGDSGGVGMEDFSFEVYDAEWNVTDSGTSSPASSNSPVPEPASLLLLGSGLLGMAGILRNKKS